MSHVATVDIEIKDLSVLDDACKRLGLEFVLGQQTYRWYGESVGDTPLPEGFTPEDLGKCDHAIRIPDNSRAYEIGVVKRRDGQSGYMLVWDFWAGGYGLQKAVGKNCGLLKQAYATEAAKQTAKRQGYSVEERQRADGSIQLILGR